MHIKYVTFPMLYEDIFVSSSLYAIFGYAREAKEDIIYYS